MHVEDPGDVPADSALVRLRRQQSFNGGNECINRRRFRNQKTMRANTVDVVEAAINHERNVPLFQSLAQTGAVAVVERMVKNGGGQAVMLH